VSVAGIIGEIGDFKKFGTQSEITPQTMGTIPPAKLNSICPESQSGFHRHGSSGLISRRLCTSLGSIINVNSVHQTFPAA